MPDLSGRRLLRRRQPRRRADRRLGRRRTRRPPPRTSSASPAPRRVSRSCATRATATSTATLDAGVAASPTSPTTRGRASAPRAGRRRGRQQRLPRGAQARAGALPRRRVGLDGRADLGDRDEADAPPRTRSRWRSTTSPRATTSASPPSRRPTTERWCPARCRRSPTSAHRGMPSSARSAGCSRWATLRSTRRSTRSRRSRRSRGRPTASRRSCVLSDGENDTPNARPSAPTRCSRTCGTCTTAHAGAGLHARLRRRRRRRHAAVDLERDGRALLRRHRPDQAQGRARRPGHELLSAGRLRPGAVSAASESASFVSRRASSARSASVNGPSARVDRARAARRGIRARSRARCR